MSNLEAKSNMKPLSPWRRRLHEIVFESDTRAGKIFDVVLLVLILLSVAVVVFESTMSEELQHSGIFMRLELFFGTIFAIEYLLRIISVKKPILYIKSFFGVIDLLAVLPMFLLFLWPDASTFIALRVLRVLRIFRILKMSRYIREVDILIAAFRSAMPKILIFMTIILTITATLGSLIYLAEGHINEGVSNIPEGIYWAIVTITTVGYGDVTPITVFGKLIASLLMIISFTVFAVPTGIISIHLAKSLQFKSLNDRSCSSCGRKNHEEDARFCKYCGGRI